MAEKLDERGLFGDADGAAAGVVESVRALGRDGGRVAVVVGGRVVARSGMIAAERAGVREGVAWTAERARALRVEDLATRAQERALTLLGKSMRSEADLRERLVGALGRPGRAGGGAAEEEEVVEAVSRAIARLRESGLVDDAAAARSVARRLARGGPVGGALLETSLERAGIGDAASRDAAEEELSSLGDVGAGDGAGGAERSMEFALGRARRDLRSAPEAVARRIAAALARRGLEDEVCREVARRAVAQTRGIPESAIGDTLDA